MFSISSAKHLMIAGIVSVLASCTSTGSTSAVSTKEASSDSRVGFQLIRNATVKLEYSTATFLIDPMLAPKGAYEGFQGTARSELRNPLTDLPVSVAEVLKADAIVLTHLHDDHWDAAAKKLVPKNMPIFTQNADDASAVRKEGFKDVRVLTEAGAEFRGTYLYKTGGQHGTDKMYAVPQLAKILGEAMGVVFQQTGYATTYIVGDTVWRPEVDQALSKFKPEVVVLNTGYAQVVGFEGSIIMGKEDMARAYKAAPQAKIIGVHMETVNHAMLSRKELRSFIEEQKLDKDRALVPNDGERYKL